MMIMIINAKKLFAGRCSRKTKLFAQTTTQKKIVCLGKMFTPPSKKLMVRP